MQDMESSSISLGLSSSSAFWRFFAHFSATAEQYHLYRVLCNIAFQGDAGWMRGFIAKDFATIGEKYTIIGT